MNIKTIEDSGRLIIVVEGLEKKPSEMDVLKNFLTGMFGAAQLPLVTDALPPVKDQEENEFVLPDADKEPLFEVGNAVCPVQEETLVSGNPEMTEIPEVTKEETVPEPVSVGTAAQDALTKDMEEVPAPEGAGCVKEESEYFPGSEKAVMEDAEENPESMPDDKEDGLWFPHDSKYAGASPEMVGEMKAEGLCYLSEMLVKPCLPPKMLEEIHRVLTVKAKTNFPLLPIDKLMGLPDNTRALFLSCYIGLLSSDERFRIFVSLDLDGWEDAHNHREIFEEIYNKVM